MLKQIISIWLIIMLLGCLIISVNGADTTAPSINIETPRTVNPIALSEWQRFYVNFTYNETGNPSNYTIKIYNNSVTIHEIYQNNELTANKNKTNNITLFFNPYATGGYYNLSISMYDNVSNYNISYQNKSIVSIIMPDTGVSVTTGNINTSLNVTSISDLTFTEKADSFINEVVTLGFLFFSIIVILFLRVPILNLSIGAITILIAFMLTDLLFYPFINIILFFIGIYDIVESVKMVR